MIRWATAVALGGVLVVGAGVVPAVPASAAHHRQPVPWSVGAFRYEGRKACHVDTAHHRVRVWWSEQQVQGRIPGADGKCGSLPALATLVRQRAEGLLTSEHRLGLPRPSSDKWLHEPNPFTGEDLNVNGGSGALDIYLNGSTGGGGLTSCIRGFVNGHARTGSYTLVGTPADLTRDNKPVYLAVLAHELAHVGQCAAHDRKGRNGTSGSAWIVEGTANMVANAVMPSSAGKPGYRFGDPPVLIDPLVQLVGRSPQQIFGAGSGKSGEDAFDTSAYDTWPFWFALTDGGRSVVKLRVLYRRVAASPHGHRSGDLSVLRHVFSGPALQRALIRAAQFDALGGRLATINVPYDFWWWWRSGPDSATTPKQRMTVTAGGQSLDLSVPAGGAAWVRVRPATPENATLKVQVTGRNRVGRHLRSKGVRVGNDIGQLVSPSSPGKWSTSVWPAPTFQVPAMNGTTMTKTGDSEAWVIFANAGTKAAKFRINASTTTS